MKPKLHGKTINKLEKLMEVAYMSNGQNSLEAIAKKVQRSEGRVRAYLKLIELIHNL